MIKRFVNSLIITLLITGANAQCKIDRRVFNAGEHATYKAFYNWNFIWIEAADVYFKVSNAKNARHFNLESVGTSLPKHDWFYRVRDTFRSQIDTTTMLPYWFHRKTTEAGYYVNNQYTFDYAKEKLFTKTENSEQSLLIDTLNLSACTFDVLSAIYYTRNLNFDNLKIGDKKPIKMAIDNELYELYIRYLGKENITTRYGEEYRCIKFSILLVEGTIFKGGEDMTVWVTDDWNHIPVLVEAKVIVGSVKAYLTHIKNHKYPIDALVHPME